METPLKGGVNTPLHTLDFTSVGSARNVIATPNTVLGAIGSTPQTHANGRKLFFFNFNLTIKNKNYYL